MSWTEDEVQRYSRHIILPEVGGRGQRRLKDARVLVIGAGAAGSAALLYLTAAGIGHLTVWDPTVLTTADVASGTGHAVVRLGQTRAASAVESAQAINPACALHILSTDCSDVVKDHHLVLASTGNWLELCAVGRQADVPVVFAGIHGAAGAVTVVRRDGPCLGCVGSETTALWGLLPESSDGPPVCAAAGVIGVAAATEVIKLILGIGDPLVGRCLVYDGWMARFDAPLFTKRPGCDLCTT